MTGSGSRAGSGTGSADIGSLHISGAYIPQQTSQDEAAAYFAVTNKGDAADELVAVQATGAAQAMLHDTVEDGGVGTMTAMSDLTIPAHQTVRLTPGHEHLMIMNPVRRLAQGQTLVLTLTFTHAGSVSLVVPVVGLTGPA
ncbi:copper chaperone PCu(A)C [Frankia sp. AgB1.8]|uniref:copper chaperone PCu(A)C n=1 Tax=Frankia sp. AgB1.8 TaxID=2792839 RepID=UPI001933917E|nr:copper chaperone PCu(A)C [Frankia sp. AgB1.8]